MDPTKDTLDVLAASTAILTYSQFLPPLASLFTIVWLGLRIWESDTVQGLRRKKRK